MILLVMFMTLLQLAHEFEYSGEHHFERDPHHAGNSHDAPQFIREGMGMIHNKKSHKVSGAKKSNKRYRSENNLRVEAEMVDIILKLIKIL